jgi:excinuclease ABC subunit C
VDTLFSVRTFEGFGPNRLAGDRTGYAATRIDARRAAQLRRLVRQDCPRDPGVYGMLNDREELIYIGKAKCLRARLLSYFRPKSRDPKAGKILAGARAIAWEKAACEFGALLRELELIQRWRPRYNVRGQPGRRRLTYVCLGRPPAPTVFLSPTPPVGSKIYGPIRGGWRAREAIRFLNDYFKLRDCPKNQPIVFSGTAELFSGLRGGCIRLELQTCMGPCIAACSEKEYRQQEQAACSFLEGRNTTLLQKLDGDMTLASRQLEFERAGSLRDRLKILTWLHESLARVRKARAESPFVYRAAGCGGPDVWYLVCQGAVMAARRAPVSTDERRDAAQSIEDSLRIADALKARMPTYAMDGVFLVSAWFRRYPEERKRIVRVSRLLAELNSISGKTRRANVH